MFPVPLKTFVHPHSVYKLEYPAHWDQVTQKDGESCGFGPHDRDDVGLWISIMPGSIDTDHFAEHMPRMMEQSLAKSDAANPRRDPTLRHHAMVADIAKEGEGGYYWLVADWATGSWLIRSDSPLDPADGGDATPDSGRDHYGALPRR